VPRPSGDDALSGPPVRYPTVKVGHARLALPMPGWVVVNNGAEGLIGSCKACGTRLDRALVREVRHYDETRLLDVICGGCERHFLAIQVEAKIEALKAEDVAEAAAQLASARSLSDLFAQGDLDLPDAA